MTVSAIHAAKMTVSASHATKMTASAIHAVCIYLMSKNVF
jgi:hypothetical protein